jgi:hypothetical protein
MPVLLTGRRGWGANRGCGQYLGLKIVMTRIWCEVSWGELITVNLIVSALQQILTIRLMRSRNMDRVCRTDVEFRVTY